MAFVKLEPGVIANMKLVLEESGIDGPIRIELQSSGCCDPSLGLSIDRLRQEDLTYESDGVTIAISPTIYERVGHVTISFRDDTLNKGFVLSSENPLNEWAGFGASQIRINPDLLYK